MLISADAAQLEWRVAVELSGDQQGLLEIRDKLDTHSLNQEAFSLPSRLIAKIYLFRTIFRGSGWAFANDPQFTHVSADPKFWDNINEKFYKKYHGLDKKHTEWAQRVKEGELIVSPFGRAWSINMVRDYRGNLKVPMSTLTNYPVQGTASDIMKLARVMVYKRIKKLGIPCMFITTVHDSICVDAPSEHLDVIARIFFDVFCDLIKAIKASFGYTWNTPLECEVKYGNNMKDMVKFA